MKENFMGLFSTIGLLCAAYCLGNFGRGIVTQFLANKQDLKNQIELGVVIVAVLYILLI